MALMASPPSTRLGIFGGSFDPVHYGHLLLAESCREQCRLSEVWFLPELVTAGVGAGTGALADLSDRPVIRLGAEGG